MTHNQSPHNDPPAAGLLEPYGARVTLRPASAGFEPQPFLAALLQELAGECAVSGASVIGHLKCLLHLPGGAALACNLTSLRRGASCSARGAAPPAALTAGLPAHLDLAVLVYGLPAGIIDHLVRAVLARLLDGSHVSWSIETGGETQRPAAC